MQTIIITLIDNKYNQIKLINWIKYHKKIGITNFLIGYIGNNNEFNNLPNYDYVKYINLSNSHIYDSNIRNINILFSIVKHIYNNFNYLIYLNTNNYINIKFKKFENKIQMFLNSKYNDKYSYIKIANENINKYDLMNFNKFINVINLNHKDINYQYFISENIIVDNDNYNNKELIKNHIYFDRNYISIT
jgi:hypothetical protein